VDCSTKNETTLKNNGWHRQFLACEPRLSEAVEEYQSLGFEVHLESIDPQACATSQGCSACFETPGVAEKFKIIFTRPGGNGQGKRQP
jgi:hypothetical protein